MTMNQVVNLHYPLSVYVVTTYQVYLKGYKTEGVAVVH